MMCSAQKAERHREGRRSAGGSHSAPRAEHRKLTPWRPGHQTPGTGDSATSSRGPRVAARRRREPRAGRRRGCGAGRGAAGARVRTRAGPRRPSPPPRESAPGERVRLGCPAGWAQEGARARPRAPPGLGSQAPAAGGAREGCPGGGAPESLFFGKYVGLAPSPGLSHRAPLH